MDRIGVIGLGKMGLPIARNLMVRGFRVTGYRRSGSPELLREGGEVAASAADVAADADVILSIVPTADDVEEIIAGPAGTLTNLKPGTIHIEMSTIDVDRKARLRDKQSVEEVKPVLDAISGPWIYTGAFGTGARMKYVANLLLAVHTVAAAEAMTLARRSGLDLQLVQKTLDESIASSAIWRQRGPLMAERAWSPAPGPISTLHPILEQIEEHAASTGLSASVFAAAKEVFDKALADGWGDLDIACVHDQVNQ